MKSLVSGLYQHSSTQTTFTRPILTANIVFWQWTLLLSRTCLSCGLTCISMMENYSSFVVKPLICVTQQLIEFYNFGCIVIASLWASDWLNTKQDMKKSYKSFYEHLIIKHMQQITTQTGPMELNQIQRNSMILCNTISSSHTKDLNQEHDLTS